jgi:hypothetical protein
MKPDGLQTPRKNAAAHEETHFQTQPKKKRKHIIRTDEIEMIDTSTQRIDQLNDT